MSEKVFINGKFLLPAQAVFTALEPELFSGWGVFETMRAVGNTIVFLPLHMKRIFAAARRLKIASPYSSSCLSRAIARVVLLNGYKDAVVRLSFYRSAAVVHTVITVKPYKAYTRRQYGKGFRGCVSSFRQDEYCPFAQVKTTSRLLFQLAYSEARKRGYDEALILNSRGVVAEGSRSNIFMVKNKLIMTPAVSCGCLPGITRAVVIGLAGKQGYKIIEGSFDPADARSADEAFLTNSLMGVMPLVSLGGRPIGGGIPGSITKGLMERYAALLLKRSSNKALCSGE
ncbi:MAG: aminotransferase class IV [Candidatus Omnitrophota bacterium]